MTSTPLPIDIHTTSRSLMRAMDDLRQARERTNAVMAEVETDRDLLRQLEGFEYVCEQRIEEAMIALDIDRYHFAGLTVSLYQGKIGLIVEVAA